MRIEFSLDLSYPGPKCKPQELLVALIGDLVEDVRTLPLRRIRLLTTSLAPDPSILTPMEQLDAAERQIRARAKWCA